ncbi:MAG: transglutaminase domain-containing protein [Anaerolineae bacterium]|nr:transglutaminase domain-containing protein [Anaerolineae bacterium]
MTPDMPTYYTQPGPMTALPDEAINRALLDGLPADVPGITAAVRNTLLHPCHAMQIGIEITDDRRRELNIRSAAGLLRAIHHVDPRPLTVARPVEQRITGTCRDFTTLAVALLRHTGIAARGRCGFGTYLRPPGADLPYIDHWISEYWRADDQRWARVDEEFDPDGELPPGINFDLSDMPFDRFLTGGDAWARCRTGEADPDQFGFAEWHGWQFILGNLLRDVASLNKVEMLPWDVWGYMPDENAPHADASRAHLDRLAALTRSGDTAFEDVLAAYDDEHIRVPPVFTSCWWMTETWFEVKLADVTEQVT